jgi:hypothetical protein
MEFQGATCCVLDLVCPPKGLYDKVWSPPAGIFWEVVEPLGGGP